MEEVKNVLANFQPLKRAGLPEDVAKMALYLVTEESSMVLGATLMIDGGASIQLPTLELDD